jgi:hypothetical protein
MLFGPRGCVRDAAHAAVPAGACDRTERTELRYTIGARGRRRIRRVLAARRKLGVRARERTTHRCRSVQPRFPWQRWASLAAATRCNVCRGAADKATWPPRVRVTCHLSRRRYGRLCVFVRARRPFCGSKEVDGVAVCFVRSTMFFASYRDPNLVKTLAAYESPPPPAAWGLEY